MLRLVLIAAVLAATPALASTDRDTAVSALAQVYNSVDLCGLTVSRARVDAYAEAARGPDDALFNVDVFRATQALYAEQRDWTKEQTDAYCVTATEAVKKTLAVSP